MMEVRQEAQQSLNALVTQWISTQTKNMEGKKIISKTGTICKYFYKIYMDTHTHICMGVLQANFCPEMSWKLGRI